MKFDRFIASRLRANSQGSFTTVIMSIAIAAVALSIAVMIITTNVITGFKNQISDKVFNFWGHIHISDTNADQNYEIKSIDYSPELVRKISDIRKVGYSRHAEDLMNGPSRTKGGVRHVQRYVLMPGIISDNKSFEGLLIRGVGVDYDSIRMKSFLIDGNWLAQEGKSNKREIVISEITAQRMQVKIDDRIVIHFVIDGEAVKRVFDVVGVYKTGLEEYDRSFALAHLADLQAILGWSSSQISGLEVFAENVADIDVLNDYIYIEVLPPHLYAQSVKTKFYQIFEWLQLQDINERVIFVLMTLVAIINMITALLIFVLERTKMIGILKALGANNWQIRKIFLYSTLRIVLIGAIIGNTLAFVLCYVQKYWGLLKLPEKDYYLSQVPIEFNIPTMMIINLAAIVLIMACMILPSMIVSHISPVKTIQFK